LALLQALALALALLLLLLVLLVLPHGKQDTHILGGPRPFEGHVLKTIGFPHGISILVPFTCSCLCVAVYCYVLC
jgi:hypothetical protein